VEALRADPTFDDALAQPLKGTGPAKAQAEAGIATRVPTGVDLPRPRRPESESVPFMPLGSRFATDPENARAAERPSQPPPAPVLRSPFGLTTPGSINKDALRGGVAGPAGAAAPRPAEPLRATSPVADIPMRREAEAPRPQGGGEEGAPRHPAAPHTATPPSSFSRPAAPADARAAPRLADARPTIELIGGIGARPSHATGSVAAAASQAFRPASKPVVAQGVVPAKTAPAASTAAAQAAKAEAAKPEARPAELARIGTVPLKAEVPAVRPVAGQDEVAAGAAPAALPKADGFEALERDLAKIVESVPVKVEPVAARPAAVPPAAKPGAAKPEARAVDAARIESPPVKVEAPKPAVKPEAAQIKPATLPQAVGLDEFERDLVKAVESVSARAEPPDAKSAPVAVSPAAKLEVAKPEVRPAEFARIESGPAKAVAPEPAVKPEVAQAKPATLPRAVGLEEFERDLEKAVEGAKTEAAVAKPVVKQEPVQAKPALVAPALDSKPAAPKTGSAEVGTVQAKAEAPAIKPAGDTSAKTSEKAQALPVAAPQAAAPAAGPATKQEAAKQESTPAMSEQASGSTPQAVAVGVAEVAAAPVETMAPTSAAKAGPATAAPETTKALSAAAPKVAALDARPAVKQEAVQAKAASGPAPEQKAVEAKVVEAEAAPPKASALVGGPSAPAAVPAKSAPAALPAKIAEASLEPANTTPADQTGTAGAVEPAGASAEKVAQAKIVPSAAAKPQAEKDVAKSAILTAKVQAPAAPIEPGAPIEPAASARPPASEKPASRADESPKLSTVAEATPTPVTPEPKKSDAGVQSGQIQETSKVTQLDTQTATPAPQAAAPDAPPKGGAQADKPRAQSKAAEKVDAQAPAADKNAAPNGKAKSATVVALPSARSPGAKAPASPKPVNPPPLQPVLDEPLAPVKRKPAKRKISGTQISFLLAVIFPLVLLSLYYVYIASNQYRSEMRFAVRGTERSSLESLGLTALTGSSTQAADAYIVIDYIHSKQVLLDMQKELGIDVRQYFSKPDIDIAYRIAPNMPLEKFIYYWRWMVDASYNSTTSITTFQVTAFDGHDAAAIAQAVLKVSDNLVNELSTKARLQLISNAQSEVTRTEDRLIEARQAVAAFRDREQTANPTMIAESDQAILQSIEKTLIELKSRRASLLSTVDSNSPSVRVLDRQIASYTAELEQKRRGIGSGGQGNGESRTLTSQLTEYNALFLEQEFAEKAYTTALASLETSQAEARRQDRYFAIAVEPNVPEIALYPMRMVNIIIAFFVLCVVWLIGYLLVQAVRDHTV